MFKPGLVDIEPIGDFYARGGGRSLVGSKVTNHSYEENLHVAQ